MKKINMHLKSLYKDFLTFAHQSAILDSHRIAFVCFFYPFETNIYFYIFYLQYNRVLRPYFDNRAILIISCCFLFIHEFPSVFIPDLVLRRFILFLNSSIILHYTKDIHKNQRYDICNICIFMYRDLYSLKFWQRIGSI